MIIVDASAAVLSLLNDGDARAQLRVEGLASPHLVDPEVVHTLRAQVRRGSVPVDAAERALDRWARLGLERISVVGLLPRIWALRDNLSAHDAA